MKTTNKMDEIINNILTIHNQHSISEVFPLNMNLKSGQPGRPKKVEIILKKHIKLLQKYDKEGIDYFPPYKYLTVMKSSSPVIKMFYELLSLCNTREKIYGLWPSMLNGSTLSTKINDPYNSLYEYLFN